MNQVILSSDGIYQINNLHGYNYTVKLDQNNKVEQIGCVNRWPLSEPKWIGDDGFILREVTKVMEAFLAVEER